MLTEACIIMLIRVNGEELKILSLSSSIVVIYLVSIFFLPVHCKTIKNITYPVQSVNLSYT